jgi:hypothetical protein
MPGCATLIERFSVSSKQLGLVSNFQIKQRHVVGLFTSMLALEKRLVSLQKGR